MTPLCVFIVAWETCRQVVRLDGRTLHAPLKDGRISVYHAAVLAPHRLITCASSLADCFPRYFLHLCYDLLSEMVLELMPCATHSRLWCDFDADSSRLPPPFSSLLISVVRSASAVVGFASFSVLFGFLLFLRSSPSILLLQRILTSSVITLRPFALYLNSWRVLFCGR